MDECDTPSFWACALMLSEITSFLSVKLKYLDAENQIRREIAQYYFEKIKHQNIVLPSINNLQLISNNLSNVWHLFVIRTTNRDKLQKHLTENGIQSLIHYPIPPHKQLAYKKWDDMSLPITKQIHNEVLSLPISSVLSQNDLNKTVDIINTYNV